MRVRPSVLALLAIVVLLLALPAPTGAAGRAHFASGLYLEVGGVVRTLFVEGPAVDAPPGLERRDVKVTLDVDIPIRLGKQDLDPGRYGVTIHLDPKKEWALTPEKGGRKARQALRMTEEATAERDLWVRFVRTGRPQQLLLVVAWGTRRGELDVVVDPATGPAPEVVGRADDASLGLERTALLGAVGDVLGAAEARGRWLMALHSIREAAKATAAGSGILLHKVTCSHESEVLRLVFEGRTRSSDYADLSLFVNRLKAQPFGKQCTSVNVEEEAVMKGAEGKEAVRFKVRADAPADRWKTWRLPTAPKVKAPDLAHELAYLDTWLQSTAGGEKAVTNVRDRLQALLDLRIETGVDLGLDPLPLRRVAGDALAHYVVMMDVGGSYEGILRFLYGVLGWGAPVWVDLQKLEEAESGVSARIRFEFLSYEPLSERLPALWAALGVDDRAEGYLDEVGTYFRGLPPMPAYPEFAETEKPVDPFMGGD